MFDGFFLSEELDSSWIDTHMPQLSKTAHRISLCSEHLDNVFSDKWSFENLQFIHFKAFNSRVVLKNDNTIPISKMLNSSMTLLEQINGSLRTRDIHRLNTLEAANSESWKTFSYPFVQRLEIRRCYFENLPILFDRLPNLIDLRIDFIFPLYLLQDTKFNFNVESVHLRTLKISQLDDLSHDLFRQLIKCTETTLQNVQFLAEFKCLVVGTFLEEIFKPCANLKKLEFSISLKHTNHSIYRCLQSFQSQWWLDNRRPIVYLQPDDSVSMQIVTLPSQYTFRFTNDLLNWYFNKANLDSPLIRFFQVRDIVINNPDDPPITLENLYTIDKIMLANNQNLTIRNCSFEAADILIEIFIEDSLAIPALPNVTHFTVNSHNKLDESTLCVWMLQMPNLKTLDICQLTTFNKLELGKGLLTMINNDQRLQPYFNQVTKVIIYSETQNQHDQTTQELIEDFQRVFQRAVLTI